LARWAADRLPSAQDLASGVREALDAYGEVSMVLGVLVLADGVPSPTDGFLILGSAETGQAVPYRVDWRQPLASAPGTVAQGISPIGPEVDGLRRVVCAVDGSVRGFESRAELVGALRSAVRAGAAGVWDVAPRSLAEAQARVARLDTMDSLLGRYHAGELTQIRNSSVVSRIAFQVADTVSTKIEFAGRFFEPCPYEPTATIPCDVRREELDSASMSAIEEGIHRTSGGSLRTCIDTGEELHLFYESHAGSRRELQAELLRVYEVVAEAVGLGPDTYIVTASRPSRVSGTSGSMYSDAFSSEIATAWLSRAYVESLATGTGLALCWLATALTRWVYDDGIFRKSLLLVDMPYLGGTAEGAHADG
jgi:hypothetical protein